MKIVHTCLRYPPASGGAEDYIQNIVTRTRDISENRDVRVLTSRLRTHAPATVLNPSLLLDDPPYVQRLHHTELPQLAYPLLQGLDYYIGKHDPQIIHGYGFWYQPADTAARYAKKRHIPFVLHPLYYENETRQKLIWRLYKSTIGRRTFAAADVVVVISPFEQSLIEEAQLPVKRFKLIPPGVDKKEFQTDTQNPFENRHISGTILLSASRIASGKGIEDVITALPEMKKYRADIQLVLVGEDFGMQQNLQRQAQALEVSDHVHFMGKVERAELIAAYQHADIFIHPSYYEAFGIVIAEAQAAGTPVIARNTSAIPYVTAPANHKNLFQSQDDIVSAVKHITSRTPEQLNAQTAEAKKYVEQNFSWDTSIKKVTELYRELVT